jgi:outer membrane protein OmpA-like peptidoglycan-associated protein
MQEPPGDRAAPGGPANGAGAAEFAELRRLIVGRDLDQLAGLQQRLDDPQIRAAETGKVLPGALKAAPGRSLREALEPVFEKSFQSSVRKHPREISDAIYPVMGPAIRSSIAAAIREFAESLNQIVEKSASWRAIRWRIEARVTGRPFTEILLTRSLLYSVEQVFLIHRKSGLLLLHLASQSAVVKDADMVSSMFSAIQDFVSDSFTQAGQELETIDVGRYKLWVQYGSKALLVGAVSGTAPVELKGVFRAALEKIHETLFSELDTFKQDDLGVFEPARPYLESCLLGQKAPNRRAQLAPWLAAAAAVALLFGLVFWQVRNQRRWDAYIDALRQQPGIAVLRAEKRGSGGVIAGLKDPKAPDPASLLAGFELDASRIRYEWQPYFSMNTPFAAEREVEADLALIEAQTIRFELASAKLPLAEAGRIEDLAAAINRVRKARPDARIAITGHTDEVGTAETNMKLSADRAAAVGEALSAQGIPPAAISATGAGNTQPLRTGGTEWDRAANRSASFRVLAGSPAAAGPGR